MEKWRVNLYVIWFCQIISLMSFGFGLPFIPFYLQELGVNDPEQLKIFTGLAGAAPALGMGIMAPIWGMLADKFGRKLMLQRSLFSAIIVLIGFGMAKQPWHIIACGLSQGLFTGTITASSALVASNTPNHRLSYSLGLLSSSTFIGWSAGPALGGFIAESTGFRTSFFIGAVFMFIAFMLISFIVREERTVISSDSSSARKKVSPKVILKPAIVVFLILLLFLRVTRTIFSPYLALYVQELRGKTEGAPSITGIISATIGLATAISGLTISRLGDKLDRGKLISRLLLIGTFLTIPLILADNILFFAVSLAILYFTIGGIEPLITSSTSERVLPENRGTLFGIQGTVGSIGWFISPVIGGYISIKYSLGALFILMPFLLFSAFIISKKTIKESVSIPDN